MSRYKAYPAYKPTYSKWVLDVPSHWLSITFKRVVLSIKDGTHGTYERKTEGFPLLSAKNVQNYGVEISESESMISVEDHHEITKNGFPSKGDLLITCVGTIGRSCIYEFDEVLSFQRSVAFLRLSKAVVPKFYKWFVESKPYQSQLEAQSKASAQSGVYMGDLVNTTTVFPSFIEQEIIAAFLDHETAKIDALIEKQQRLIELLKEKRQAVISHAVTKGLNPNAPMKDSGVKWLGEVPAHWEVFFTKRLFSLECHPAPINNEMELLSVYTDIGVRPRQELEERGNKASTTDGYWLVKKDDLVVNKLLAWMGAVGYSNYDGVTSPAYDILRKRRNLNTKFFHFLFRTKLAQSEFKRWSRGIMEMRLRLYFEELGRISMPFPPADEQDEIVRSIESLECKYDDLIATATRQIELAQERRTALISAAVTGMIDVRDWQAAA